MKVIQPSFTVLGITPEGYNSPLQFIELIARTCYKSEDRITSESAETFVRGLIKRGHEAMLEFGNITVRFICDRGVSHELVRHRLCSFAQESTRYCDYSGELEVIWPTMLGTYESIIAFQAKYENMDYYDVNTPHYNWYSSIRCAETAYKNLREDHIQPQIARSVLPTCLKTEIVMSGNFREWRHIFKLRTAKAAHPQMRELMVPLLKYCKENVAVLFDDIIVED